MSKVFFLTLVNKLDLVMAYSRISLAELTKAAVLQAVINILGGCCKRSTEKSDSYNNNN